MYERGLDLKAVQELLGHNWLSTTTRYIHVHSDHIEHAWTEANSRIDNRLSSPSARTGAVKAIATTTTNQTRKG